MRRAGKSLPEQRVVLTWERTLGVTNTASIVRLVTHGRPPASVTDGERVLLDLLGRIDRNAYAFVLLPGGYIRTQWPSRWSGPTGWAPNVADFVELQRAARDAAWRLLSPRVRRRARRVRAIAFGVDSACAITGKYAELIAFYDTRTGSLSITGKSLPRSDQAKLARVADLRSHFVRVGDETVLLLGCHDLNIFSPRGRGRQAPNGKLAQLRREMDRLVAASAPSMVLHLPHGTDTARTWTASWKALTTQCRSIHAWASAISFFNINDEEPRADITAVLVATRGGCSCADLIYRRRATSTVART